MSDADALLAISGLTGHTAVAAYCWTANILLTVCPVAPQAKLRNMEKQVEWVKAERDEATATASSEAKELSARVKEGEAALARLKVQPCFSDARYVHAHRSHP